MVPEPASTSIPEPALAPIFNDHGTDAFIGKTCKIGTPLKLAHGGTLGARSFAKDGESRLMCGTKRHPDVEDSTTIYPNSTILGANVFLMHSVHPNSLVVTKETRLEILDKNAKKKEGRG